MRTIEQMVDDLMEAARGHGEAHADDDVTEWSTGVLAKKEELLGRITVLAARKRKRPPSMWKLINSYLEATRSLPEDAYEDESRYGDTLARAAELQLEIRRRLKKIKREFPTVAAMLDGEL
jgi:hypothetical protein